MIHLIKSNNINLPQSERCKYSVDKIKNVFILPDDDKTSKNRTAALIVQYQRDIFSLSLSGGNTRQLTDKGKMIPEFAIQGHMNKIFFAQKNLERSDIYVLEISKKNRKVVKRKVFSLSCRLIALEADHSNEII